MNPNRIKNVEEKVVEKPTKPLYNFHCIICQDGVKLFSQLYGHFVTKHCKFVKENWLSCPVVMGIASRKNNKCSSWFHSDNELHLHIQQKHNNIRD